MAQIIVPFYGQHRLVLRCLKSVQVSTSGRSRIILVDDCSSAAEREAVERFCGGLDCEIRILSHTENRGFKESVRTGLRESSDPQVILLNSDTIVTPDFDVSLLEVLNRQTQVRAVAPVSNHPTDLYQFREYLHEAPQLIREDPYRAVARLALRTRRLAGNQVSYSPYLTGMCLALDRAALEEAGGFGDEYRHGYFEDLALSCRLRTLGYRLAIREDCFVYHEGHASYRKRAQQEKFDIIRHNFGVFSSQWGHLPEHSDLLQKMESAGTQYPI
jgi:GT2 family glycosyltransferase